MPQKKKKARKDEEAALSGEDEREPEPEPEPEVQEDDDAEEENEDEGEGEGEVDEERAARLRKRSRAVARRKGYRSLATRGGFSPNLASADASRDVTSNIISVNEAIRACKWAPSLANAVTYGATLDEYKERVALATESLPKGPASVYRASIEVFARKVMNDAVQRAFDGQAKRVSANTMMAVLRPVAPSLRFSFVAPQGLVRHAQTTIIGTEERKAPALGVHPMDEAQMKAEQAMLPKQIEHDKLIKKKIAERKAKRGKSPAPAAASAGRKDKEGRSKSRPVAA